MNDVNLERILESHDGTKELINEFLEFARCSEKLIVFGAGVGGEKLYSILNKEGLDNRICAYSDNNKLKHNKCFMNTDLRIVEPDSLVKTYGYDVEIIIASSAYIEIKNQLCSYGFAHENIHLYNFSFMDLEYTDSEFIHDHINDFSRAYNRLADEKSKDIFVDILNYKITKEEKWLMVLQKYVDDECEQYFPQNLYEKRNDECFLDIGAYVGDTYQNFKKRINTYEAYYAFEADKEMFERLSDNVDEEVQLYNYAAWNEDTLLNFNNNAGSSRIVEGEGSNVKAIAIDSIFSDKKVTFVKMDIEGAEKEALQGMKNLIKLNKPLLAICVYHLRDDYYKITDLIESIVPNEYTYYFRHYRYTPTETVCYAVPKNRLVK